jgi:MoaA/NifB/PqqE/SkfB family radical SAM enzyme
MCPFVNSNLKKTMLPYDVLKNVIDEVCDGALMVGFSGWGEPLMHPQLSSMINYVISKNIVCAVGTNGTLLESKARELIDSGVNIINVSVDSIGPKHDEIRGVPGTFDRVVRGIRAIKSNTLRYDPIITVNCTISEYGYEHLTDLYKEMRDLDIDVFSVAHPAFIRTPRMLKAQDRIFKESAIPMYDISWDAVDTAYQAIDINRLYEKTSTLMTKDEGIMVSFTPNLVELDELQTYYEFKKFVVLKDVRCAWLSAYVSSHGDLTMCDYYKLGNVIEDGGFRKAWNNNRYQVFRKLLKKHKRFPICVSCCRY